MARASHRVACVATIPSLIASLACSSGKEDPVEPTVREIALSQTIDGSHPTAQTSVYALQLFSGQFFVVQLEVLSGELTVSVFEEGNGARLASDPRNQQLQRARAHFGDVRHW
jgi:hypothetical protein